MNEKIKEIIAKQLEIEASEIKDEAVLTEELEADSLDMVEIVMALEDEFSIEIPEKDTASIKTVQDIVRYIESRQA